jgi:hypothetical protein
MAVLRSIFTLTYFIICSLSQKVGLRVNALVTTDANFLFANKKTLSILSTSSVLASSTNNYQSIARSIDELFPPQGLDQRIALSRKDGYW